MYEYECYQKEELIKELLLLEKHMTNFDCPECMTKHSLTIKALCEETYKMTPYVNEKQMFQAISREMDLLLAHDFRNSKKELPMIRRMRKEMLIILPKKCIIKKFKVKR